MMLEGRDGDRGVLVRAAGSWMTAPTVPLHPRHQFSPLTWDAGLGGLVLDGGEKHHRGPQFDATLVLWTVPGGGWAGLTVASDDGRPNDRAPDWDRGFRQGGYISPTPIPVSDASSVNPPHAICRSICSRV
jgi:hypothetical protein